MDLQFDPTQPTMSRCLSDSLQPLFRHVDISQLPVVDRMVFDINRRAILEKSRTRPAPKERKPGSEEVFIRLIEDTEKRITAKRNVKTSIDIHPNSSANVSVYDRLQEDTKARRRSSNTRMKLKEEQENPVVVKTKGSGVDPKKLVTRLMQDAEVRRRKADLLRKEKERREVEEAKRLAEMHHPKRKPDEMSLRRLLAPHRRVKTGVERSTDRHKGRNNPEDDSSPDLQPELSLPSPSKPSDSSPLPETIWSHSPFYFHLDHPPTPPHYDSSRQSKKSSPGVNMS